MSGCWMRMRKKDVKMLLSYDEEEIGSCMTTNYICVPENLSIKQTMNDLVAVVTYYGLAWLLLIR